MQIVETSLPGVLMIEPRIFSDSRGFFLESFNAERFAADGLPSVFRQDNHSRSRRGVLRGLHFQRRYPQGKLITVVHGEVFDVAVDIRVGSPTFGRWTGITLSGSEPRFVWIPEGFAHGFCVLSDCADLIYKCTEVYHADDDNGILWCDKEIGIDWPVESPLLSEKDGRYGTLGESRAILPSYSDDIRR